MAEPQDRFTVPLDGVAASPMIYHLLNDGFRCARCGKTHVPESPAHGAEFGTIADVYLSHCEAHARFLCADCFEKARKIVGEFLKGGKE